MNASLPNTVIPIDSPAATLETAGGKGENLSRLARSGMPVPPGFIITTDAYHDYVGANGLADKIHSAVNKLTLSDLSDLENASKSIRSDFSAGEMPARLNSAILEAYRKTFSRNNSSVPLAVRSSATTEDLPDLSFAGQQDTYLNVIGEEQLLKAVINCWSSLWTARAIGYRLRNNLHQDDTSLAVIVQEMIPSEVSGVLFSANPLTGKLNETVIDAVFGLGEGLVSGQTEPDHFIVDTQTGLIVSKSFGAKKVATRARSGGGVESIKENAGSIPTLSDDEILHVASVGQQIQAGYGAPQDIEWAIANGSLYILQSRPITTLFPVPEVSFDPLIVWFSFGSVQGLPGPMTPLGLEMVRHVVTGGYKLFRMRIQPKDVKVFVPAGERIWVRISDLIRNPIGSKIFAGALSFIEPSTGRILKGLIEDPHLYAGQGKLKFRTIRRLAGFFFTLLLQVMRNMFQPKKARARFDAWVNHYLSQAIVVRAANRFEQLANALDFMKTGTTNVFRYLLPRFIPIFGPCMAMMNILQKHTRDNPSLALEVTRALPNNVTTEMDLALWKVAKTISTDSASCHIFQIRSAEDLVKEYLAGTLPAPSQDAVAGFLKAYGMRGVGEIDLGQPRWREDPTPIMHSLKSYLQIDTSMAPDALFRKGEQAALDAIEKIAAKARRQPGGFIKEKQVRAAARRIRLLMGARETPKFLAIRIMGIAREALLSAGKEFAEVGTIDRPEDLFFLRVSELEALARNENLDWKAIIAGRRTVYDRELRRRQVPRVLVSDGRTFYEGIGADSDNSEMITGSPVSPGVAEGIVRVVLDPTKTQLLPGEILVCPGTDPAWTPLFMAACGLITEVGGMMTHGSVVAREYGIPAVVGVDRATQRLTDGQRIRLDGTEGKIIFLDHIVSEE